MILPTLCALLLQAPYRNPTDVGVKVSTFEIYQTHDTEYCFEEQYLLGRMRWSAELLWRIERPLEECR